jgi:hypothetical protein
VPTSCTPLQAMILTMCLQWTLTWKPPFQGTFAHAILKCCVSTDIRGR